MSVQHGGAMIVADPRNEIGQIADAGYYLALRVGFAFPAEEVNALPRAWVDHYTVQRFMLADPVIRWVYSHTGAIRWSEITLEDPRNVMRAAREFGLQHGAAVCCFDGSADGRRSFGTFVRSDRPFSDGELGQLEGLLRQLHEDKSPPTNLTNAEIEALRMVKEGLRLKQIAHELGVSEGAIKQRLKNAKSKLGANTSAQAATLASDFGLI